MNPQLRERFEIHRRDEDKYVDALNDKSWGRAGQILDSMDKDIAKGYLHEKYEAWKTNEENKEKAQKKLEREWEEEEKDMMERFQN